MTPPDYPLGTTVTLSREGGVVAFTGPADAADRALRHFVAGYLRERRDEIADAAARRVRLLPNPAERWAVRKGIDAAVAFLSGKSSDKRTPTPDA